MKPLPILLASVGLAAVAAFATVKIFEPSRAAEPPVPTEQIRERLTALETQISQLRKDMEAKPAVASPSDTNRMSNADLDDAVSRWMTKNGPKFAASNEAPGGTGANLTAKPPVKKDSMDAASLFAKLRSSQTTAEERRQLWAKVKEAGLIDEVLGAFEKNAKDNPADADAQVEYGHALVEKLQTLQSGPEMGKFATMSDAAFDKALQINPQHWEARFSKAIGLSFWPPIFGKQAEAISQFETLRKQQEDLGGVKPDYANTYIFLGNLYQQQGKPDKALEVWKKGSSLFPDNNDLKGAIAGTGK